MTAVATRGRVPSHEDLDRLDDHDGASTGPHQHADRSRGRPPLGAGRLRRGRAQGLAFAEAVCAPRISGRLAGRSVGFDVEVHEADERGLSLAARGPVGFDVAYQLTPTDAGSEVHASVAGAHPNRGLAGRLLAEATGALLTAGASEGAVSRLVREAAAA